jgi:hypothetical protein
MEDRLTIRINQTDADNIITIANALRSGRRPFPTRTEAVKLALAAVAADAARFVPPLMAPRGHPALRTNSKRAIAVGRGTDGTTVVA